MNFLKRLSLVRVLLTTSDDNAIRARLKAAGALSREDEEVARVTAVLRGWVSRQTEPFTTDDAMEAIGISKGHRTHAIKAQVGVALQGLGCERFLRRIPYTPRREIHFNPPLVTERSSYSSQPHWRSQ